VIAVQVRHEHGFDRVRCDARAAQPLERGCPHQPRGKAFQFKYYRGGALRNCEGFDFPEVNRAPSDKICYLIFMETNYSVPLQISLNCWKHHAGFIKKQIESIRNINELEKLKTHMLKTGGSQMDLYIGKYSPQKIYNQILDTLHQNKIFESQQYKNWLLKEEKYYRHIELKDKSIWILRLGDDISRYIHIHPGRYSPHTIRVKATTLKTAVFLLFFEQLGEIKSFETETVNQIRRKFLKEPPLKSFASAYGLKRLIDLLRNVV
jgi:hypothetical protein